MRKIRQLSRRVRKRIKEEAVSWEEGKDGGGRQGDRKATGSMIGRSDSQRLRNHRLQTLSGWGQEVAVLTDGWKRDRGWSRG